MAERGPSEATGALVWVVATLGAVLAGVLIGVGLWAARHPASSGPGRPLAAHQRAAGAVPSTTPTTTATPDGSSVATGACLRAADTDGGGGGANGSVVAGDCGQDHVMEVVGTVDVSGSFTSRPTDEEWLALLGRQCPDRLEDYVGDRYDPHGVLRLRIAFPTAEQWAAGDRAGECLAFVATGADGAPAVVRQSVRDIDQAPPIRPGDCTRLAEAAGAAPLSVACDQAHQLEVLGPLELAGRFEHYPSGTEWLGLHEACVGLLSERFGADHQSASLSSPGNRLAALAVPIPIESWLAGRRTAVCAVAEVDAAGVPVTRQAPLTA
jgi:hypothetical protein